MKKIALFFASIAPGIFLIGYNIGTGSITTMAASGAAYGMSMTWPLLLSCVFTYILIVTFGRFTAITGLTALHAFRIHFGSGVSLLVLASLLISEWVSCMGVMAIVVEVVKEWSRPLTRTGEGFSPLIMAAIFIGVLYYIFWQGKHRFFERVLAFFVAIMGLSFVMTMFMVIPDPVEIMRGMVPEIPRTSEKMLIMAGMVGTTMGGVLYVVRSILVQEKGWTAKDLKLERRDAGISAGLMFFLSAAVMAAAAGTLFPQGLKIDNAMDMVNLMEPLAGRFAVSVFVAGIVCAGLSSLFPNALLAPWLLADFEGKPRDMKSTRSRILVLFGFSLGLVVPLFGGRPVYLMIVSQAGTIIATPLILILMQILLNKKSIMGEYTASPAKNLTLGLIGIFTLLMAVAGATGLWEDIQKLFQS
ncbi:MAG: divalent metal cation transporter [Bacteroidia bacterium]